MGPGLVTGASDDDPSGIATYSQADAQYGLAFLWTALLTLPLMAAVQEICDRTALDIDAVSAAVGKGKTEPEGHHDDGGNPQDVEGQPADPGPGRRTARRSSRRLGPFSGGAPAQIVRSAETARAKQMI